MDNEISPYKLVHEVAKLAKEMEEEHRNPTSEQKSTIYKEVNKAKKRPNYVLEAYNQIGKPRTEDHAE